MIPDAVVRVRFKTSDEGGRKTEIAGQVYACPMFFDGQGFECRLSLNGLTLKLGEYYELPVKFMNRDLVQSNLFPGKEFMIWEGKDIGAGLVLALNNPLDIV
jgi:hypothetical protein